MDRPTVYLLIITSITNAYVFGYSDGQGTPEDPFQIATAQELIDLGNEPNDYDKHFILVSDIDLSGWLFNRAVIAADTNHASGFQGARFIGCLNGNGYIISHLHIQGDGYLGLFGELGSGAVISDLGLEIIDVNGTSNYIGGLAAYNRGAAISSCYTTGSINGRSHIGGLAGEDACTDFCNISSSFWDSQTSGLDQSDGGLGLSTADMQEIDTYLDAGWDFIGHIENGTRDDWFMPENDYPHLKWETEFNEPVNIAIILERKRKHKKQAFRRMIARIIP